MSAFISTLSLNLHMQEVPPVMKRQRHVLILLRDRQGRFVLGQKKMYPKGISRLVGGGVEKYEAFVRAGARELFEELKYPAPWKSLVPLAQVYARLTDMHGQTWQFTTAVFLVDLDARPLEPGDDLDGIARLTPGEFGELVQQYRQLPKEIDPQVGFAWFDYGQLYAEIHRVALESLHKWERRRKLLQEK